MNLQEHLKHERNKRNLTQRDLSYDLHVSPQTINMIENGKTCSDNLLIRLALYYELEKHYFIKIKYENNE